MVGISKSSPSVILHPLQWVGNFENQFNDRFIAHHTMLKPSSQTSTWPNLQLVKKPLTKLARWSCLPNKIKSNHIRNWSHLVSIWHCTKSVDEFSTSSIDLNGFLLCCYDDVIVNIYCYRVRLVVCEKRIFEKFSPGECLDSLVLAVCY